MITAIKSSNLFLVSGPASISRPGTSIEDMARPPGEDSATLQQIGIVINPVSFPKGLWPFSQVEKGRYSGIWGIWGKSLNWH